MSVPGDPGDGGQQQGSQRYGQSPAEPGPEYRPGAGYGGPSARPRNGFGVAALVLGVLALLLSWTIIGGVVLGVLALIFGVLGRSRAKRGEATNGGVSVAGIVLGIIGVIIAIALIAFGLSLFNSPVGRDYQQCLQQAGGNPAMIQQCVDELGRQISGG
jgi:O-antigen ligase